MGGSRQKFAVGWELTRSTFWPQVSQDNDGLLSFFERPTFHSSDELVLRIKGTCFSRKAKTLLSCDLGNGTPWGKVTSQDASLTRKNE